MKIDCSIIILSYNTQLITKKCLQRVKEAKNYAQKMGIHTEVIVVDNGSSDGSVEMVKRDYPWVKLFALKENVGFARGNNLGMKKARGLYFLILNSDAFLEKETIVLALNYLKNFPSCDVLGCRLNFEGGRLQPSGGFLPTLGNVFCWMLGIDKFIFVRDLVKPFHPNFSSFFSKDREIGWITGAFMFLKREVFEKTGGFDENYFMYAEEVEWCKRIKDFGFKIYFTPRFSVIHLKGASLGLVRKESFIREIEGIIYFFNKHHPQDLFLVRLTLFFGCFLRLIIFLILRNKERVGAYQQIITQKLWKKLPS